VTESMLHLIGETFDERFRIEKLIGKGGMGAVFLARHLLMDKPVALKVLARHLSEEPNQVTRFNQEAQNSSRLRHPNTIRVFDFGRAEQGHLYLAMEYLEGLELSKVLKRDAPLPAERAVHILRQVAKSMAEAHNIGLIHRDVKPDNIFISDVYGERDFVKVLDFGIAKVVNDEDLANLTQTGFICGTPTYLAPEIAMGTSITPATDIYSIGVVAYQMLVGRPPFRADTPIAVVMKHIHDQVPPFAPDQPAPKGFQELIMEMLSKDPSARPATADELLDRLDEFSAPQASRRVRGTAPPPLPVNAREVSTAEAPTVGGQALETVPGRAPMTSEQRNAQTSALPSPRGPRPETSAKSSPTRALVGALMALGVVAVLFAWPGTQSIFEDAPALRPARTTPTAAETAVTAARALAVEPEQLREKPNTALAAVESEARRPVNTAARVVTLRSVPAGAVVHDGDAQLGVTPLDVTAGDSEGSARHIVVRLDGFKDQAVALDGSRALVEITLARSPTSAKSDKQGTQSAKPRPAKGRSRSGKGSERGGKRTDRWRDFEAR
jgi:serine/threonine protein kinase